MNKKISLKLSYLVFFSIVLVISSAILAGYAQDNTWIKTFNSQYFDCATSVIRTSDGNYLIAGMTDNGKKIKNFGCPFTVLKIDPSGQILWQKQIGGKEEKKSKSNLIVQNAYNQPLPGSNRPEKIIETKDNGYAIIVNSYLLKLDQMGNFLWAKNYDCLFRLTSFQELEDGEFIACGTAKSIKPGNSSLIVLKLDAEGNILWSKGYKEKGISTNRDYYFDIHVFENGDLMLGNRCQKDKHNCVQIICMDFQGGVKWSKIYRIADTSVYRNFGFYALNLTQKDEIIFSMHCNWKGHTGQGSIITKLNATGDIIWSKCMISPYHGYDFYIHDIYCLSNDEIALSGSVTPVMLSANRNLNALVLKMQQDGSVKWIKCFGIDYKKYNCDYIAQVTESDNNGLICVGSTNSFSEPCSYDFFITKMDSKGDIDGTSNFLREIPPENSKKIQISALEIEKEDIDFQAIDKECHYNEIEHCVVSRGGYIGKDITLNPPVADFKLLDPDPEWDDKVRFDASLSSDPDGSIVSYRWNFGDGKTGKGINVTHQFPKIGGFIAGQGNYEVKLTVTDDHSLSSSKIIPITVGYILSYKKKGRVGIPAALRNKDDRIAEYQIEIITGDEPEAGTDSFVYLALYGPDGENGRLGSGELHPNDALDCYGPLEKGNTDTFTNKGYNLEEVEFITLRHNNAYNKPEWYIKEMKITNKNNGKIWFFYPDQWLAMNKPPEHQVWTKLFPVEKPIAEFAYSPDEPLIGESIKFDASLSQDPNGRIVEYSWNFEEAKGSNTAMIIDHQFQKEGVQKVSLTVTDDEGVSVTTTKYIDIKKNLIGRVESIIEWAWDSPVKIDFPYNARDTIHTIHVLEIGRSTNPHFHVDWKIKDNSSTIGHSLYVSSELAMYDFNLWDWIIGETEGHSKTGSDSRWEEYSRSGTWCLNPLQSSPVTKYKLILTGKSYEESKTESEIFYASLPLPQDLNSISPTVKTAAPNWIAGRYELALIFRAMSQHWKNIKNSSLSEENYRKETERILGSTHCLFGSTTAGGCATNLGLDFLEVAANVAGNAAFSGATAVAGPANIAYTYITWAVDTLSWSADHWDEKFDDFSIGFATNTPTADNLEISLGELFPAILEEADESMSFIYNDGLVNDWYVKLQNEKTKLHEVAAKASSAYDDAEPILNPYSIPNFEHEVLRFLELITEMANFQTGILDEVF